MNMPATHLVAAQFFAIKMVLDERLEVSFILHFAQHKCEFGKINKVQMVTKDNFQRESRNIFYFFFAKLHFIQIQNKSKCKA